MSAYASTPFPLIRHWARGTLSVVDNGGDDLGRNYQHDFFQLGRDSGSLEQLSGDLRENTLNILKVSLRYDKPLDPLLLLKLTDQLDPRRPSTARFFLSLALMFPSEVIRIHHVFKGLITVILLLPAEALESGYISWVYDNTPQDIFQIIMNDFSGWNRGIARVFQSWREMSEDPVEMRQRIVDLQNHLEEATRIWTPVRKVLTEFNEVNKLLLMGKLVKTVEGLRHSIQEQLDESEKRAAELERLQGERCPLEYRVQLADSEQRHPRYLPLVPRWLHEMTRGGVPPKSRSWTTTSRAHTLHTEATSPDASSGWFDRVSSPCWSFHVPLPSLHPTFARPPKMFRNMIATFTRRCLPCSLATLASWPSSPPSSRIYIPAHEGGDVPLATTVSRQKTLFCFTV